MSSSLGSTTVSCTCFTRRARTQAQAQLRRVEKPGLRKATILILISLCYNPNTCVYAIKRKEEFPSPSMHTHANQLPISATNKPTNQSPPSNPLVAASNLSHLLPVKEVRRRSMLIGAERRWKERRLSRGWKLEVQKAKGELSRCRYGSYANASSLRCICNRKYVSERDLRRLSTPYLKCIQNR